MNATVITYGSLLAAIVCETIGTTCLKQSEQFTRLVPTVIMGVSYLCAFYLLSIAIRVLPVGVAYAIWSGVGIVLISAIGVVVFRQHLDMPAYIGLGLIIAGIMVVNVFSKSVTH